MSPMYDSGQIPQKTGNWTSPSFDRGIVREELQCIIPGYRRYEFGQDMVATDPVMVIFAVSLSQDG